jgi:hypothetical protein
MNEGGKIMANSESQQLQGDDRVITAAREEAQKVLDSTFTHLKEVASIAATDGTRLFFPNGIELLFFKVEATLVNGIKATVEIKIAGEKGLKNLGQDSLANQESDRQEVSAAHQT